MLSRAKAEEEQAGHAGALPATPMPSRPPEPGLLPSRTLEVWVHSTTKTPNWAICHVVSLLLCSLCSAPSPPSSSDQGVVGLVISARCSLQPSTGPYQVPHRELTRILPVLIPRVDGSFFPFKYKRRTPISLIFRIGSLTRDNLQRRGSNKVVRVGAALFNRCQRLCILAGTSSGIANIRSSAL